MEKKEEKFERQNRSEKENYVYVCASGGFKRIFSRLEDGMRSSTQFFSMITAVYRRRRRYVMMRVKNTF